MKKFLNYTIIFFIVLMSFNIYAFENSGILYRDVYVSKPLSIDGDSVFFEIFYDNKISKNEKYNNNISNKIFKYDLGKKEDEEIFNLINGESALEIMSDEEKISLLTYDSTKNIFLYTRLNNGIIKKKKIDISNNNPYIFKAGNKIYLSYEDASIKDKIRTKFVCMDINGDIKTIIEYDLQAKDGLYNGEYLSTIGGNKYEIYISKINMKDGNFDGKNVISNIYCYDTRQDKFYDMGFKYKFFISSISGNEDFIVVNKYEKENPDEKTINIYYRKDNENKIVDQKTNMLGIKNIYPDRNGFIIDSFKGIFILNADNMKLDILDNDRTSEKVVLYNLDDVFLYKYFPLKSFFEIRSI